MSKVVWNFSENSSVLVWPFVPKFPPIVMILISFRLSSKCMRLLSLKKKPFSHSLTNRDVGSEETG